MNDDNKTFMDLGALSVTMATIIGIVPALVGLVAFIYYSIQIWESETIKKLTGRN